MWSLVYTGQARKDAKKLSSAGLKQTAQALLDIIRQNPYQNPPPYEKLVGDLPAPTRAASTFSTGWFIRFSNKKKS